MRQLKHWERRALGWLATVPGPRLLAALVFVFALWIMVDVFFLSITGGLAQSTYDGMVRARLVAPAQDPRIVIVDIDESALARMAPEFGRWPWPRDTLATVLDHIESQGPAAIVWDIVFSDADRLSPGGDLAFDQSVVRSRHSHFGVVRLPGKNDKLSQITQDKLPQLWATKTDLTPGPRATVAMIAPVLQGVAQSPLGFNNGYVDKDGVLRRYRYFEKLPDGGVIQSLPMAVVRSLRPDAYMRWLDWFNAKARHADAEGATDGDVLISWRSKANVYPHVNFADLFAAADGSTPLAPVPSLAGKIVIVGATAPSLHDTHPTPLSSTQAGVETLATVLDNALHERVTHEIPKWAGALLATLLCVAVALWSHHRSVSSLGPAMVGLPAMLLVLSYASLHTASVFLDLHLSAGLTLLFLAVLRLWHQLRKRHWCGDLPECDDALAVWTWSFDAAWSDDQLQRLMGVLTSKAPDTRLLLLDPEPVGAWGLRWHPFATCWALVGPPSQMAHAQKDLLHSQATMGVRVSPVQNVPKEVAPEHRQALVASLALQGWAGLKQPSSILELKP
ncbi:MAG: CHASE2 domain-containing protein [Limnohabitans sp.]